MFRYTALVIDRNVGDVRILLLKDMAMDDDGIRQTGWKAGACLIDGVPETVACADLPGALRLIADQAEALASANAAVLASQAPSTSGQPVAAQ